MTAGSGPEATAGAFDLFNKVTNRKIGVRATTDKIIAIKVFITSIIFKSF
jgi:hypothetical protein